MREPTQRTADALAGTSIVAWFLSHLAQINDVLQFIALVIAIVSGLIAMYKHLKSKNVQP